MTTEPALLRTRKAWLILSRTQQPRSLRDVSNAVAAIAKLKPALLFLDVQMPEMSGFEVLEAIAGAEMPAVIFVTAFDHYAVKAFQVHALDYLLKSFDRERFGQAVHRAKNGNYQGTRT